MFLSTGIRDQYCFNSHKAGGNFSTERESRIFGTRGDTPIQNGHRCSSEVLKRTPKRYQDPVVWAWLEIYFSPKSYQFLYVLQFISCHIFQYSNRYCKSSCCRPLRLNTLIAG